MVYKELGKIQQKLKVGKGQKNDFGGYKYRSASDILEAVKPLLPSGYSIICDDEIIFLGERYYVNATAIFSDGENFIKVSGQARESFDKKGMDSSQITGAASSYARKYALCGLFAIDDTKDADSMNNSGTVVSEPKKAVTKDFLLGELKSCKTLADLNSYHKQYSGRIKQHKDGEEIIKLYKELKINLTKGD